MNRKKGILGYLVSFVVVIVVLGGVVAVLRINDIKSIGDLYSFSKRKSEEIEECYSKKGEGCLVIPSGSSGNDSLTKPTDNGSGVINEGTNGGNNPNSGSSSPQNEFQLTDKELGYVGPIKGQAYVQDVIKVQKDKMKEFIDDLKTMSPDKVKYSNRDWPHWALMSADNTCWTVKEEVLAKQAIPDSLEFIDKNHQPTKDKSKACSISSGKWIDPYSGDTIKEVDMMDVDHIVSLEQANKMGGADWSAEKKLEYSNDVDSVLLAVSKDSRKEKGSKSPSSYIPKNKKYRCEYGKNYTLVTKNYGLSITKKDKKALSELVSECKK